MATREQREERKNYKTETVEEYLARGGQIQKVELEPSFEEGFQIPKEKSPSYKTTVEAVCYSDLCRLHQRSHQNKNGKLIGIYEAGKEVPRVCPDCGNFLWLNPKTSGITELEEE